MGCPRFQEAPGDTRRAHIALPANERYIQPGREVYFNRIRHPSQGSGRAARTPKTGHVRSCEADEDGEYGRQGRVALKNQPGVTADIW